MKVTVKWHHVIAVERVVEVDEAAFDDWRQVNQGIGEDRDAALAEWIDGLDTDFHGEVFSDWRTSEPLPSDFELQYSEVICASDAQPTDP